MTLKETIGKIEKMSGVRLLTVTALMIGALITIGTFFNKPCNLVVVGSEHHDFPISLQPF